MQHKCNEKNPVQPVLVSKGSGIDPKKNALLKTASEMGQLQTETKIERLFRLRRGVYVVLTKYNHPSLSDSLQAIGQLKADSFLSVSQNNMP